MIQEDLQSYTSPFLFRAYTSKQAQMPIMQRTTPKKKAIASPASTASTTGSTQSSEVRTNDCAETEVVMVGPWDGWVLSSEGFQRNDICVIVSDLKYSLPGTQKLGGSTWQCLTGSSHYRNNLNILFLVLVCPTVLASSDVSRLK